MPLKNYEYFLAIAEEGNISRAAEKLYLTQPSLSKHLKRLEESLGVELFSRKSYPMQLTEAGVLYRNYVEELLSKENQLEQRFAELQEGLQGTVTIAMTEWRAGLILPLLLPRLHEAYPHITLSVLEGSHQEMYSWLEHDLADFAVMHLPNKFQSLHLDVLNTENVLYIISKDSPLLHQLPFPALPGSIQHLTAEQFLLFKDQPFILGEKGQHIRQIALDFFDSLHISPPIAIELKGNQAKYNLVRSGLGAAFIGNASFGKAAELYPDLCYFSVGDPPLHWDLAFAYPQNRVLSIRTQRVMELLRRIAVS